MKKAKILVVEDQKIISLEIKERLTEMGYQVVGAATSGKQAIQLAADMFPDLVLMDIKLEGGMDGIEAAEVIRNLIDCPIIYLTAYADDKTIQRAKITEPYGYIVKPLDERELRSAIEIALYKNKMEKKLKENETRYRSIVKSLEGLLYINDKNYNIIYSNLNLDDITGLSGKTCYHYMYKLKEPCKKCPMDKLNNGLTTRMEIFDKESSRCFYRISTPIQLENNNVVYQHYLVDITERKKNEENIFSMLHEKEILLHEIHHRVKNNFQLIISFIRLQISKSSDDVVIHNLKMIENRLISISLVHEDLYTSADLSKIHLKTYIEKLLKHIINAYNDRASSININHVIENIFLPVDKVIPIGIIINELVTNSLKHAFLADKNGNIWVKFGKEDDKYVLEVLDDGIGFPYDAYIDKPKGLGLQILQSLSKQLNCNTEFINNNGSHIRLKFSS